MTPANTTKTDEIQIAQNLLALLTGYRSARALYVTVKLGIADLLKEGPRSATELAEKTGTHGPSLMRLLRATASLGVFEEIEPSVFAQNECSLYFCTDHPTGMYYLALLLGSETEIAVTHELEYTIQTGQPAFKHIYGMDFPTYLTQNADYGRTFWQAMRAYAFMEHEPILQAYDFSTISTLVDCAGGTGSFLVALLNKYPSMRGILFDQASAMARARAQVEQAGCADRCNLQVGDMFEEVPAGADAYLLKRVLHGWDDDRCLTILNNCRRAMRPHSKLLICEVLMSSTNMKGRDDLYDLIALVRYPAKVHERTSDEFYALLTSAKLQPIRIIPTISMHSIIEATL
jgi:hypothetical protein